MALKDFPDTIEVTLGSAWNGKNGLEEDKTITLQRVDDKDEWTEDGTDTPDDSTNRLKFKPTYAGTSGGFWGIVDIFIAPANQNNWDDQFKCTTYGEDLIPDYTFNEVWTGYDPEGYTDNTDFFTDVGDFHYNDEIFKTMEESGTPAPNTPPDEPANPSPSDGADDVAIDTTLSVDVSDDDGDSMDVTFYWDDDTEIEEVTDVSDGETAETSSLDLDGGSSYSWYAIADDMTDTTESSTWSFDTEVVTPSVTTDSVSNIQSTQADGNGEITDTGVEDADERGFVWDTSSQDDPGDTSPSSSSYGDSVDETGTYGMGTYSLTIDGLDGGTTYHVRAYAHNSAGYSYGGEVSFTTPKSVPIASATSQVTGEAVSGSAAYTIGVGSGYAETTGGEINYTVTANMQVVSAYANVYGEPGGGNVTSEVSLAGGYSVAAGEPVAGTASHSVSVASGVADVYGESVSILSETVKIASGVASACGESAEGTVSANAKPSSGHAETRGEAVDGSARFSVGISGAYAELIGHAVRFDAVAAMQPVSGHSHSSGESSGITVSANAKPASGHAKSRGERIRGSATVSVGIAAGSAEAYGNAITYGAVASVRAVSAYAGVYGESPSVEVIGFVPLSSGYAITVGGSIGVGEVTYNVTPSSGYSNAYGGAVQWAFIGFPLSVAMDGSDRRLTWDGEADTVYVITDGEIYGSTSGDSVKIRDSYTIREILKAGRANTEVQWEAILQTPLDEVQLSWTGDAHEEPGGYYRAEIRPDGGDWSGLTSTQSQSYTTDPLEDGTYDLRIIAVDAEGDESESDTATITISSAPEPPSGIEWEFDSTTQTLTVTWEESPSGDVDTYPVRSSAGEEVLDLNADPVQETSDLSYEKTFTDETGIWLILVRAEDSDGHEDANLSQMIRVDIRDGQEHGNPADPRFLEAGPAPGGKAELTWEYMPMFEEGTAAPGVAQEARIYGNEGSGDVDWTTPIDTINMDGPTSAQSMSWESEELEAGTYSYGVRIATDTHPDGVESDSKRVVSADVDGDVPAEPSLSVTKV